MKYTISAQKVGPEITLRGCFSSPADMVKELTGEGYVIRKYRTDDGNIVAGELLEKECLIRELGMESEKTKHISRKMTKRFIALAIWNGIITVGLILATILSSLK